MCGRFAKFSDNPAIARRYFHHRLAGTQAPVRYNVPPGTGIDTITAVDTHTVTFQVMHWGYRPHWAGEKAPKPINAKAETVATSRYFRAAFAHKRCLVPANGWFEWQPTDTGKQPFYITCASTEDPEAALFFAALWEYSDSHSPACAIITRPAAPALAVIHPRQPALLDPSSLQAWLDPTLVDRDSIRRAIKPLDPARLKVWPVSSAVNLPGNDEPGLLVPDYAATTASTTF